ncbi:hypothetical protein J8Z24_09590 [Pseudoalteromonas sp. SCSIO 43201]|uniref:hypothetical protein n=1 Tax=Pseudoalteromonas TaxID=53246 RepID=UPI002074BC1C|nr:MULTISPECIES: hypothetical protein [Pseudoalteromonas]MDW7548208.1 hypothetical protein [Pseudoalteromonas peptidolytica]USD27239.1 hypothetical protein J8Z24_09590 [Pseudoalteromonas sp. SCSIO 43201]
MSIETYNKLKENPQSIIQPLLPTLIAAKLQHEQSTKSVDAVIETVNSMDATFGWAMYRDEIIKTTVLTGRRDLIEGEWSNGTKTIKVKLLGEHQYSFVCMEATTEKTQQQAYKKQTLITRYGPATYFIWYQLIDERWHPMAQQFIGFSEEQA